MRRFLILLSGLCTTLHAAAQQPDAQQYIYPIRNVSGLYSANFGEIRPGHFHTGVDIKTEGVEGKPVVATADGYVSRVVLTPSGYGRVLYLVLDNGTTAVYGHLSRFCDAIEQRVREERYRNRSNSADIRFEPQQQRVRQGEVIAFSGNSGSSGGPHLHFELRDTPTQRYLNPVKAGIIRPKDNLPPRIMRIHYVEIDSVAGVCHHAAEESYAVVRGADGRYRLTREGPIPVGRKGYFVAEVTDRRNGVNNTFGVWRLAASLDGNPYFEFRMDDFLPSQTRYCDAVSHYPLQVATRNEAIRLAQLAEAPDCFYSRMENRGIVYTAEGERKRMHIEAEDDCGNRSQLEFDIRGRSGAFHAQADTAAVLLHPDRAQTVSVGREARLQIPAGTLFEPLYARPERASAPTPRQDVRVLSPAYRLLSDTLPMRTTATLTIRAEVPRALQLHTTLAAVSRSGRLSFIGGNYADGAVTAQTRATGAMVLVADTIPPRISPRFKDGADLSQAASVSFTASDNFSGIASVTLTIDGEWVPCDRFPMRGTLVHLFDTPPTHRHHTIQLTVRDGCDNLSRWSGRFYR